MYEAILFLTDGFEEIEAITTLDILRRGGVSAISVSLTGNREVTGSHEIIVKADMLFNELNDTKGAMLILPGGPGVSNMHKHELLLELLRIHNAEGGRIAAICAAPTVLGKLGVLLDKTAVCYPTLTEKLNSAKVGQVSTITDGNITTSKGPASSTDFALEILRIIKGDTDAAKVAEAMLVT
ncbi:MAG: DJ-1/PfpI family protein [Defluviitaleaceae bacterium]|nr:DJ-1/PfpI family protein [Defluviitaleaceae bacterium]